MIKNVFYAIGAVALMTSVAACNQKASTQPVADTLVESEPDNALVQPVSEDLITGEELVCGDEVMQFKRIERIYKYDDTAYLSLSIEVPAESSQVTKQMMELVDSNFVYYTDCRLPVHAAVTTPQQMVAAFDASGKEFVDVIAPDNMSNGEFAFNFTFATRPVYINADVITYQVFINADTGGAHGDTQYYYMTFDRKSGNEMTAGQLIPYGSIERVRVELVKSLAENENLSITEYLNRVNEYVNADETFDAITVENFPIYDIALVAQGYVFCYPEYTIAPYSEGIAVVTVPAIHTQQ